MMANWCSNTVVFEGEPEAITAIQELFQSMKEKEEKTEEGQLPKLMEDTNGGYFFNIYWNESDEGQFQYQTKWSPNIEVVQQIAEHYNVDFIQDYEDMGNLVYGRTIFSEKLLTDIYLEDEDFETYSYDEETDIYHFEGEEHESDSEILETLLERKIAKQQLATIKISRL